ncbi:hypothetical protein BDV38DRAFT_115407 [Aspergillus pseudotamarii]|uniref:Uncharacterized protein n=1 Tax=Aspergillus pseudotamarii TaxID=132259 RepID=A0A5N6SSP8_ASPPS|nr:uncharacterized protein BDV38DRAFT_115407 [Aspergillus pseudotamarii]KAE8136154.1 hypothetical protein BDV38DRAFT_115407 [Aspergillus pseudotamarii]
MIGWLLPSASLFLSVCWFAALPCKHSFNQTVHVPSFFFFHFNDCKAVAALDGYNPI